MSTPSSENLSGPVGDKPTRVRWLIFALACGSSFVLYLHRYSWGFIKADIRDEFGWSEVQLGWLDSLFTVSYGVGQIPSGILCDWFGPHGLLGSIILAWSLSMGLVALAGGYTTMVLARLMFGAGQAGCYPTLTKISKLWFPMSVRTSVQGWIATFFGRGGGAVSFILFGTVLMGWLELTWRQSLVVLMVIGVLFGFVFLFLFRNRPEDHWMANEAEVDLVTGDDPEVSEATGSRLKWGSVLRSGNMWMFYIQQFTSAFADNIYTNWIPLFLLVVKGADMKSAGWMSALPLVGGAIGGMLGGTIQNWLIARGGNRRWARSWIGMVGKLLATVFMFASLGFDSAVVIVGFFFLVKFFGDWSQPTVWGTVTDLAGRNAASVFASVNTVGSIAGFVAGPVIGGIILWYSQQLTIESESVASHPLTAESHDARLDLWKVSYQDTAHKNLVADQSGGRLVTEDGVDWQFRVTSENAFVSAIDGEPVPEALQANLCRFDAMRGRIRLVWSREPAASQITLDYDYRDYGSGWNALFIFLGVIYLISSLSWLFVDCTKKLEVIGGDESA